MQTTIRTVWQTLRPTWLPLIKAASPLIFLLAYFGSAAHAAVIEWQTPADGTFSDGTSWVGGVAPLSTDDVSFASGGVNYNVDFTSNTTTQSVTVRDGSSAVFRHVKWNMNGNTYTIEGAGGLNVRSPNDFGVTAALRISAGTVSADIVDIGVAGPGGREENGDGEIELMNATLNTGQIRIGSDGYTGNLLVENGSSATATNIFIDNTNTTAGLNAEDTGSSLVADSIILGGAGGGRLRIWDGGSVTLSNSLTAGGARDTNITMWFGSLDVPTLNIVGDGSACKRVDLRVSASSTLTTDTVNVGSQNGCLTGEVDGWVNTGDFTLGVGGGSTDGDYGDISLYEFNNGGNIFVGANSKLRLTGDTVVGGDIALTGKDFGGGNIGEAKLEMFGDLAASSSNIRVNEHAHLQFDSFDATVQRVEIAGGRVSGYFTNLTGDIVNGAHGFAGIFDPSWVFRITGDYTQSDLGMLAITLSLEYDALNITGNAFLDGTVDVGVSQFFDPQLGDFFDIVAADSITGTFDTVNLATLEGDLFLTTSYVTEGGRDIFRISVVPIPGAIWLFVSGLALLGAYRKR